jgi:signal transduction histidine kinase
MLHNIAFGIIIGLLFVCIVILFCVLLVKLYINKVKNYTEQLYQKDIDFQIALNSTIIETQEQVLNNISQDLHDDAGQQLTAINFQIENLKLDSEVLNNQLEPLSQSVGNLSKSIRSISHSLNNQLLLQQDLIKAITAETERLQVNTKLEVQLCIKNKIKKQFTTNEKIVIYRIFQELVNNCLKHANATILKIELEASDNFIMTITDNGKGFDLDQIKNKKTISLGLQSLNQRAKIINYSVTIHSKLNHGTTIILSENSNN